MFFGFIDTLKIVTIFQIFLISIFLVFNSKRNRKRNLLLVAFIMSKALFLLDTLLIGYHQAVMPVTPNLILIGSSFQWLIGPTLFFAIVVTTHKNFVFKYKHLMNALPFLLHLGFMISQFHIQSYEVKYAMLQNWFPYNEPWSKPFGCANYIQFAIYGILALRVLAGVREEMFRFTSQSIERNIFYFKFLVYDFIIAWGINTVCMFVQLGAVASIILWAATVINIFFIANTIVYSGLRFPEIFYEDVSLKPKYEKNLVPVDERQEYAVQLREYMTVEKPYLNPSLSLTDLASQLAVPTYTLSQVLNQEIKQNFYNFVNHYRLEESKRLLTDNTPKDATILEVVYKSGFNSKSVFNSAFKKHTGMTPSEFRKYLHVRSSSLSATIS